MKKIMTLVLALCLCVAVTVPTGAAEVEDGKVLFDTFVAKLEELAQSDNPRMEKMLSNVERGAGSNGKYYEKTTGKPADEFTQMPVMDQCVWFFTYTEAAAMLQSGEYDFCFGTEKKFFLNTLSGTLGFINFVKDDDLTQAYRDLMSWQYDYIIENGAVYCFMTDETSLEMTDIVTVVPKEPVSSGGLTEAETQEVLDSLTPDEKVEIEQAFTEDKPTAPEPAPAPVVPEQTPEKDGLGLIDILLIVGGGLGVGAVAYFVVRKLKEGE